MSDVPYVGEDLVSEDSIFRRLPLGIDKRQRIRFDALVYSADVITYAWRMMTRVAGEIGPRPDQMNRFQRVALLSSAWTIVDQLDAVRQLLVALKPEGVEPSEKTVELLDCLSQVRKLRNGMDHLNQGIENRAAAKGDVPPVLGVLGYVYFDPANPEWATTCAVKSGAMHGQELSFFPNPVGQKCQAPAGLFQLQAFGVTFEIGPALKKLHAWLAQHGPEWEEGVKAQIEAEAVRQGVPPEKALEHSVADLVIAIVIGPLEQSQAAVHAGPSGADAGTMKP